MAKKSTTMTTIIKSHMRNNLHDVQNKASRKI